MFAEMSNEALLITAITTLAGVISVVFAALWKTAVWMRENVVKPAVSSHLELIDQLKDTLPKQAATLVSIAKSNKEIEKSSSEQLELHKQQMTQLDKLASDSGMQTRLLEDQKAWAAEVARKLEEKEAREHKP